MKKCNIHYIGGDFICFQMSNVNICGPVIAYLDNITNLEILPYLLLFSEVLKRILIIKYRERSGSVVECLTRDRRAAGSSLTGVTALWSLSKTHLS